MRPTLALAALIAFAGCASSGGGEGALRSDTVRLGTPMASSSLVGMRDFVVRAYTECPAGAPCAPESYRLAFSNVGQNALSSAFMSVRLRADGGPLRTWDSGEQEFTPLPNTYGEFLSISVPRGVFEEVARAETVRVYLGDLEFVLTRGDRQSFVELLERTGGAGEA